MVGLGAGAVVVGLGTCQEPGVQTEVSLLPRAVGFLHIITRMQRNTNCTTLHVYNIEPGSNGQGDSHVALSILSDLRSRQVIKNGETRYVGTQVTDGRSQDLLL